MGLAKDDLCLTDNVAGLVRLNLGQKRKRIDFGPEFDILGGLKVKFARFKLAKRAWESRQVPCGSGDRLERLD